MILYPKKYFEKISDISNEFLKQNQIKALILDVDNTLIDFDKNISEDTIKWCNKMKEEGIICCILSNSNKKEKVEMVANKLQLPYFYFATKPLKRGFKKAINKIQEQNKTIKNENIATVGDQIFTDIIGANRLGLYPILLKPIAEKDIFVTKIKRPIENYVIKKWKSKEEGK